MITYFIISTALLIALFFMAINDDEGGVAVICFIAWMLFSLLPSLVYDEYDVVETKIDKSEVNYIVNDLDYSRIVIIPLEGNNENFNIDKTMTIVYQDAYQIRKIDSLEFDFIHKENHNMWGSKISEKIDIEFK